MTKTDGWSAAGDVALSGVLSRLLCAILCSRRVTLYSPIHRITRFCVLVLAMQKVAI